MDYRFYLNDLEIDEPIGWADFELSMKRDDIYHGMQFTASTGTLRFYGDAANYLILNKSTDGLAANVKFIAQSRCNEEDDFEEIISGRLNFGKYKETCGNMCFIEIPFEEDSCQVIFKNKFDQKVDIDSLLAQDLATALPGYTQLGRLIKMPAVALDARVEGYVADDGFRPLQPGFSQACDEPAGGSKTMYVRPDYADEKFNAISTGQLSGGTNCEAVSGEAGPMTPQVLFEEDKNAKCFNNDFILEARLKGTWFAIPYLTGTVNLVEAIAIIWNGEGTLDANGIWVGQQNIQTSPVSMPTSGNAFDVSFNITLTADQLKENPAIYVVLAFVTNTTTDGNPQNDFSVGAIFDLDTFFKLSTKKICPDSDVQYYMLHEALSRVVESITNGCVRVKSDYYGRIDSQPFAADQDGCGSLRMVTSGLKLRAAPDAKFFVSAKDLITGIWAIDNIGFGFDIDPVIPNRLILNIEPIDFFYRDSEILFLDFISEVVTEIQENLYYSKINVGYKKWEAQEINGLNEFNSNREYRTSLETINSVLEIQSELIAGGIPAEITRQQTFADSGAADTTYDNDTFIFCLDRNAYDFVVEQDKILNPINIFDPPTTLNYRISPLRNLMRWFRSIVNSYSNPNSSNSRTFFNAGTGNFIASGILDDNSNCRLENGVNNIDENGNLGIGNFADQSKAMPLFKNETTTFEYPLSIGQWKELNSKPYGYISFTCGNSSVMQKGFIKEIKFKPAQGMATFILRSKWS